MAVIEQLRTSSFEEWRLKTNQDSANLGDIATIYSTDSLNGGVDVFDITTTDYFGTHGVLVKAVNDLNARKLRRSGDTIAFLTVTGALNGSTAAFTSTLAATGNFAINTNKFTVAANTGNTVTAGTMTVSSNAASTTSSTGALIVTGGVGVGGAVNLGSTLSVIGDVAINTNKFTVAATSGNTLIAGTLGVSGISSFAAVNSGNTAITGTLSVSSNATLSGTANNVGTITTGVWNGSIVSPTYGGTGINNGAKTITLGGNFTTSGAYSTTLTSTNTTSITLPTSGTLAVIDNPLSQFASTTSAQLLSVLSDATGTGYSVFSISPALTGTPTSPTANQDTNTTQIATTQFFVNQASSASPTMNGVVAVGTSLRFSRGDHVHPTDTSRSPVNSPTFTGLVIAPAGNASQAGGLRLTQGTVKTTPVVGDSGGVEYDGSYLSIINSAGARKTLAYLDSSITGNATNVTGTVAIANGGTNLTAAGSTNTFLGVSSSPGVLEYKTLTAGAGIALTFGAGSLTIASSGAIPDGSSTDTFFRVGQNLLVGSRLDDVVTHSSIISSNALEVRPGYGNSITKLISLKSDTAGASEVFYIGATGDTVIGANKFTVAASSGNTVIAGTSSLAGDLTINTNKFMVAATSGDVTIAGQVAIASVATVKTYTATTSSTSLTALVTVSASSYRSGEFVITGVDSTGNKYQVAKYLIIHNGSTANQVEYGSIDIGGQVGVFSSDYSGGNFRLLVTPASANSTTFKVVATLTV